MNRRRSHFSKESILTLQRRVNLRCSNPDCRVQTSSPLDSHSYKLIGEAAHICAASPGGARYDDTMNESQRHNIENGIWLCANCHKMVDRDPLKYGVDTLKNWKQQSEEITSNEIGLRLPSKSDATEQLAALFTARTKEFIPEGISNIHTASVSALKLIDPRFNIISEYKSGVTTLILEAMEPVPLDFSFRKNCSDGKELYKKLLEHAEGFTVDTNDVEVIGSPLLSELTKMPKGNFSIAPSTVEARLKMSLSCSKNGEFSSLDDVIGRIGIGTKSFGFTGKMYDGLISIKVSSSCVKEASKRQKLKVNISFNFQKWVGQNICSLEYFKQARSLFELFNDGLGA